MSNFDKACQEMAMVIDFLGKAYGETTIKPCLEEIVILDMLGKARKLMLEMDKISVALNARGHS